MFIAILDGQFTEITSDDSAKDDKGFFELIIHIIIEKYASSNNTEPDEALPPNAGRFKKLSFKITKTLKKLRDFVVRQAKLIVFGHDGRDANPEEKAKLNEEKQKNKMDAELKFDKNDDEDREAALQDVQMYLNDEIELEPNGDNENTDMGHARIERADDEDRKGFMTVFKL